MSCYLHGLSSGLIEAKAKISIERNKRNGRSQEQHIKLMNVVQDDINGNKAGRQGNSRPKGSGTAAQKVAAYRTEHPSSTVTEVARALNISRATVYKRWDSN